MARGSRVEWTKENLERVLSAAGTTEHQALAEELGVSINTVYSTRQRVRLAGGIDEFLASAYMTSAVYKRKPPETMREQLERIYLLGVARAGRNGDYPQYTLTLPARVGARWVEQWGRQIRFEILEDGIKIVPVKPVPVAELPEWAEDA